MEPTSRASGAFSLENIPGEYFRREDERPDSEFYRSPRLVAHIDDQAIAALGNFFRPRIPDGAEVLDLMSAYLTHLPLEVRARCRRVTGLGLSAAEMAANVQLTDFLVQSLNDNSSLPFADESFGVALCTVSVQYLLRPAEVFAEVRRVLRPGGRFLVSFSNRCFPTKATQLWLSTDDNQHAALVRLIFESSGAWKDIAVDDLSPHPGRSDPIYCVSAAKP